MINILIVEDQTLMRQGLKTIIDLEPGFAVIGEAADGEAGIDAALALRPDIILMDVQMPKRTGIEATLAICKQWPGARIVILTTFGRDDTVFQAVRAGALGFLLKDAPAEMLLNTLTRVYAGEVFIQADIASRALRDALLAPASGSPDALSDRENGVLKLLAQGLSNKDIAERLSITEGTVKNHVSNVLAKLHADNRTHAAEIARKRGLA
jgi:two-component system, NarL family, response regulator DegU